MSHASTSLVHPHIYPPDGIHRPDAFSIKYPERMTAVARFSARTRERNHRHVAFLGYCLGIRRPFSVIFIHHCAIAPAEKMMRSERCYFILRSTHSNSKRLLKFIIDLSATKKKIQIRSLPTTCAHLVQPYDARTSKKAKRHIRFYGARDTSIGPREGEPVAPHDNNHFLGNKTWRTPFKNTPEQRF